MNLENKVAVVTGAAGGIGSELSRALTMQGARVVVSDLNADAANSLAQELNCIAVQCDVSDEQSVINLVETAERELGQVDLFCSNAGFGAGEPSHAASASNELWEKSWQVHVMAHVYASRALLPKMLERGDGYLLNVASAAGLLSQIGDSAYTVTKHAAVAFAESLAIAHGDQGITVSVVCPQYVNTDILMITKEQRQQDLPGVLSPEEAVAIIIEGIQNDEFLITPHPEVRKMMLNRASDPARWLDGMRRFKQTLVNEKGEFSVAKIFGL